MDAAMSLLEVVGQKLVDCYNAYKEMQRITLRLGTTLHLVEKLVIDRSKEERLQGYIQETLIDQLRSLDVLLSEIQSTCQSTVGKAKAFFGTCCGRGAEMYVIQLSDINDQLQETISYANSEVLVVTASATEELAGGTAAKRILHEGGKKFWRQRYKNEMELSYAKFTNGLASEKNEMMRIFGGHLAGLETCLRGRIDTNADGIVVVDEYATFCAEGSKGLSSNADMVDIIVHAATSGSLRCAMLTGHQAPITCAANISDYFATGDSSAVVKVWVLEPGHVDLLSVCALTRASQAVSHLCFVSCDNKICLFAAAGSIFEVDVASGARLGVAAAANEVNVASMRGEDDYLIYTGSFPSKYCYVLQRASTYPFSKVGLVGGSHQESVDVQMCGDHTHMAVMYRCGTVDVWNYRNLTKVCNVVTDSGRKSVMHVYPTSEKNIHGRFWITFADAKEKCFEVVPPSSVQVVEERVLPIPLRPYPKGRYSDTVCAAYQSGQIHIANRQSHQSAAITMLDCMHMSSIHCTKHASIVVGLVGNTPTIVVYDHRNSSLDLSKLVPVVVMSSGEWTANVSVTPGYSSWPHYRHELICITDKNTKEELLMSVCNTNAISLYNTDLKLLFQAQLRFGEAWMPSSITTIVCRVNLRGKYEIVIGAADGRLHRHKMQDTFSESNGGNCTMDMRREVLGHFVVEGLANIYDPVKPPPSLLMKELNKMFSEATRDVKRLLLGFEVELLRANASNLNRQVFHKLEEELLAIRSTPVPTVPCVLGCSDFVNQFRCSKNWAHATGVQRMYLGVAHCKGCHSRLKNREIVWQTCIDCANKREAPDRCMTCHLEAVPHNMTQCYNCYSRSKKEILCGIVTMAVLGDALLLGCITKKVHQEVGFLSSVSVSTMEVRGRLQTYVPHYNNVASTDLFGGIFAATVSSSHVSLFDADRIVHLDSCVVTTLPCEDTCTAIIFMPYAGPFGVGDSRGCRGWIAMGTSSGVCRLALITSTGTKQEKSLAVESTCVIQPQQPFVCSLACSNNRRFLVVGSNTGGISVVDLCNGLPGEANAAKYGPAVIMKLQGHRNVSVSSLVFTTGSLFSAAIDGTVMRWPCEMFTSEGLHARHPILLAPVYSTDTFRRGGMTKLLLASRQWEWRTSSTDEWCSLRHSLPIVLHLRKAAEASQSNPTVHVNWQEGAVRGTVTLDADAYRQKGLTRLTLNLNGNIPRDLMMLEMVDQKPIKESKLAFLVGESTDTHDAEPEKTVTLEFPDFGTVLSDLREEIPTMKEYALYFRIVICTLTPSTAVRVFNGTGTDLLCEAAGAAAGHPLWLSLGVNTALQDSKLTLRLARHGATHSASAEISTDDVDERMTRLRPRGSFFVRSARGDTDDDDRPCLAIWPM